MELTDRCTGAIPGTGTALKELLCLGKFSPQSQRLECNQQPLSQLPVTRAQLCEVWLWPYRVTKKTQKFLKSKQMESCETTGKLQPCKIRRRKNKNVTPSRSQQSKDWGEKHQHGMYKPWGRKASLEDRNSAGSKVSSVQEAAEGGREALQSNSWHNWESTQSHRKTHKIHKRIQLSIFRWDSMLAFQHSQDISSFSGESEKCPRIPFIVPHALTSHSCTKGNELKDHASLCQNH